MDFSKMGKRSHKQIDIEKSTELIEEYLFGTSIRFNKAKELILSISPSSEILLEWAKRYHRNHKTDAKRLGEISYLYLISSKGDAAKINEMALGLIEQSEKENLKIAVSMFREGCRMGNKYAAASYMYCLLTGKGIRKNIKAAAKVYFDYKEKGIELSRAFSSSAQKGKAIRIPKSTIWRREMTSLRLGKISKAISDKFFVPMSAIFALPNVYWACKEAESAYNEDAVIAAEVAKGNLEAADGCRDGGCTESLMAGQRVLFGYLGVFSLILAAIIALCTGHIPNWLVYTICVLFFYPSLYGAEGKITCVFTSIPPLAVLGYGMYKAWELDWNNILSDLNLKFILSVIVSVGICGILAFLVVFSLWLISNFLMGFWFHYLVAIEWLYGSFKAFIFALLSLGLTIGGGYLLYQNGIIF